MSEPREDEKVQIVLTDVTGIWGLAGMERIYDVMFADNGVAFVVVVSGLKMAARAAGVQFGLAGALATGALSGNKKARKQFEGLTLGQIVKLNEKSFYVPYVEVKQASVKKGTLVAKMNFELPQGRFRCQFSKAQFDEAQQALSTRLGAMLTEAD